MLGKLLKHEWKATSKFFIPLFLSALILTPLTRFVTSIPILQEGILQIIPVIFSIIYVIILVFMVAIAYVLIIYRFYKNMVTEEGYLTHTLPVKTSTHIWSKLITSCIWIILSIVVMLVSIFGFFITPNRWNIMYNEFSDFFHMLSTFYEQSHVGTFSLLFLEFFIIFIITVIFSILFVYTAICIGQVLVKSHRVFGSFFSAFLLYITTGILSFIAFAPIILLFVSKVNKISETGLPLTEQSMKVFHLFTTIFLPYTILLFLILAAIYFIISNYIMKKQLNLE